MVKRGSNLNVESMQQVQSRSQESSSGSGVNVGVLNGGKVLVQLCQDVDAQDVLADKQRMFPLAGRLNGESHQPQEFPVWFLLFSSGVTGAFHSMASFCRVLQKEAKLNCGHEPFL